MNILLMALAYFLYTIFKPDKSTDFLKGINLEKIMPLINLFNDGGGDLGALLGSDLFKDFNFLGMDMSKILPVIELLNGLKNKKETPPEQDSSDTQNPDFTGDTATKFPLAPISDIADKNITYSLTRYLSGE